MSPGTLCALKAEEYDLNGSQLVPVPAGVPFTVGDIEVTPFSVPHDAAEPVAFTMNCGGAKITQLTDIGYMPDHVAKQLRESDVLILESNHDLEMLRVGPYPWTLKQRLMGRYGHLSNAAVGRYIREQFDGQAQHMVLAHLSSKNNHPAIAKHEAARALRDRGLADTQLMVTSQDEPTEPIRL
jgi:phosphoribosyl 1,2-cyclic phosphodiesterase